MVAHDCRFFDDGGFVGNHNFESHLAREQRVMSELYCRKSTGTKLVDNSIATAVVEIAEMNWMETSFPI